MRATCLIAITVLCAAGATVARAEEPDDFRTNPIAAAFGAAPLIWNPRLSPDGERLAQIQMHPSGVSLARVLNIGTGEVTTLVAGDAVDSRIPSEVRWCDWENETRLVCAVRGLNPRPSAVSSMVGINDDGSDRQALFASGIVDWLPDDPERVLVRKGYGVAQLNVYNGAVTNEVGGPTRVAEWITDGRGKPRLYRRLVGKERWYVRDTRDAGWSPLHKADLTDTEDVFRPIGFTENNELLFFDYYEGRHALLALDLEHERMQRVVHAHDKLDVTTAHFLGKYERFVAVAYIDDRPRLKFFDERVGMIHAALQARFGEKNVSIVDEDWNRRYYLILVDDADDPGRYYRFDSERNVLLDLLPVYPLLADRQLAPVRTVSYPGRDGIPIPAYLTMPTTSSGELPPAVVLPHDGPSRRDYLRFDFLAQYLAANGYTVLQTNYRGSAGYGKEWEGQGGYRDWRRAIDDILEGTQYLAREGIADARRICIVGWGYGGYAALMSTIEKSGLYRCVVSIAGVTDPRSHGSIRGRSARAFVGSDDDVLDAGSALERVTKIEVPTLLVHGELDVEVLLGQSATLARALDRLGRDVELVRYEYADHDISQERYRIDLLTRLTEFLSTHLSE